MTQLDEELANRVVTLLNDLLILDSVAVRQLVSARVPCNSLIAKHPTVQVFVRPSTPGQSLGILGILNGLIGVNDAGWGGVCAVFDTQGNILRFERSQPNEHWPSSPPKELRDE
jgi:hypothetical protein